MTTPTIDQVREMLERNPDYLDHRFAHDFSRLTGRTEAEILRNVRSLAMLEEMTLSGPSKPRRALQMACRMILHWYNTADTIPLDDLVGFVASSGQQCLWAILLAKVNAGYKVEITRV